MNEFTSNVTALLSNWVFWALLVFYYVSSALIGGMEMPDEKSSKSYRYWFRVLNKFAANLDRAAKAVHVPGSE